jgi:hypothetical protein
MRRPPTPVEGQAARDVGGHRESAPTSSAPRRKNQAVQLRCSPRFRRLVDLLHQLGPRPTGELLIELATAHGIEGDILDRLERMARLDPAMVALVDAREWPPLPMHEVAA